MSGERMRLLHRRSPGLFGKPKVPETRIRDDEVAEHTCACSRPVGEAGMTRPRDAGIRGAGVNSAIPRAAKEDRR